ncbi:hypothetical protein METBIDRAFT_30863 [Metschnikowia bicuspidata var. bicuspidata NRRL YB-4993]|uniref:Uncharacterized protein n=1 Tax=Metschnikowia bicuspidata var. bicuspidata NRRL YB-4993 TaxID=869754 RepID=A0A1A0HD54_9ASCO|nr:hypothetical protein METBIDRAFT_30863 [Metschnikowia bicuspidata var. bicuspidata NRRL YB-4993]OBA21863.1 hypothetical protein METBIDRAFT_30863 [Metschnikowia bicuspidata var. bicuspidata NRRL YB-4993]
MLLARIKPSEFHGILSQFSVLAKSFTLVVLAFRGTWPEIAKVARGFKRSLRSWCSNQATPHQAPDDVQAPKAPFYVQRCRSPKGSFFYVQRLVANARLQLTRESQWVIRLEARS